LLFKSQKKHVIKFLVASCCKNKTSRTRLSSFIICLRNARNVFILSKCLIVVFAVSFKVISRVLINIDMTRYLLYQRLRCYRHV